MILIKMKIEGTLNENVPLVDTDGLKGKWMISYVGRNSFFGISQKNRKNEGGDDGKEGAFLLIGGAKPRLIKKIIN